MFLVRPLRSSGFAVAALLLLCGCPTETGPQAPSCTPADEQVVDELTALVDGEEWIGERTQFQVVPAGMMVGFTQDSTHTMTIRLRRSSIFTVDEETGDVDIDDGDDIEDIYDGQVAPTDFSVGDGSRDGADITLVNAGDTLHSSNASDEGFLRITEFAVDEDTGVTTMLGCGWFDAEEQDGPAEASVTDLSFAVLPQ